MCTVESLTLFLSPVFYLDLYVLVDDTSISYGSFMRTKHLFVLIHIRNKGEVVTVKHVLALVLLLWIIFVICVCQSILSCLFLAALWSPVGKGLASWLSCM